MSCLALAFITHMRWHISHCLFKTTSNQLQHISQTSGISRPQTAWNNSLIVSHRNVIHHKVGVICRDTPQYYYVYHSVYQQTFICYLYKLLMFWWAPLRWKQTMCFGSYTEINPLKLVSKFFGPDVTTTCSWTDAKYSSIYRLCIPRGGEYLL